MASPAIWLGALQSDVRGAVTAFQALRNRGYEYTHAGGSAWIKEMFLVEGETEPSGDRAVQYQAVLDAMFTIQWLDEQLAAGHATNLLRVMQ